MPGRSRLVTGGAALSAVALGAFALSAATPAVAEPSTGVVLNEVYGGGGNSGATYTNDFIELVNRSDESIDLTGWSVQYHPRSASSGSWRVTPLEGSIEPGQLYLIAQARGNGGTEELPDADVTGDIPMSGNDGTVALVESTEALTCGTDCAADPAIVDLVGYGTAEIAEGSPIAGASNVFSAQRTEAGDSDDNAADFVVDEPTPGADNSAGAPAPECPAEPGDTRIRDIQGDAWLSPLDDENVTDVPGIVTATGPQGFWMQDPEPDDDPSTSEGVYVYLGSNPTVQQGDAVTVSGEISDYYQLSSGETFPETANLSLTEITNPTVAVCSSGNPIPVEHITGDDIPDVYAPDAPTGNVEDLGRLDPTRSAMEFWEAREGMNVAVTDARVIGPGNQYGEIYLTVKPDEYASERGGAVNTGYQNTPTGRVTVSPVSGEVPPANVGDVIAGDTVGPVDYILYGGYSIAATEFGDHVDNELERQTATPHTEDQLAVATYNVENLTVGDSDEKFAELAAGVVDGLASPDIVTLEEIQDDNGRDDDGFVDATQTLDRLVAEIEAAGGPAYEWRQINPEDKMDGGAPGGNIRVAFLFDPQRVEFVDRPGGDATTGVTVETGDDGAPELSISPGRIDPGNDAWFESRKPLAGEFVFNGDKVFVVVNHFNSKGGDQNADGRYQPPNRVTEEQRIAQAEVVNRFVDDVLAVDPQAGVVIAGDINDYQFSPALEALTGGDDPVLLDLINTLPETERYTYVFNGVSQVLDHILVTPSLAPAAEYEVVHLNAEFSHQASDHDPQVVRLGFDAPACTDTVSGLHIGALSITDGVVCLDGAIQVGSVTVADGARLIITDSTVLGKVEATDASLVTVTTGVLVGGVNITGGFGQVAVTGSIVTGPVNLTDNVGGVVFAGNTVIGTTDCSGNDPAPVDNGQANIWIGPTKGQCGKL